MDNIDFKIGQLTKELVAQRLKSMENPCAVAADLARQTLDVAFKGQPADASQVVSDTCYGAMQGLMLAGQDFPKAAVLILQAVSDVSNTHGQDPTAMMFAAMRGFARLSKLCTDAQVHEIKMLIEAHFNGAGEAFSAALAEQPDQTRAMKPLL